MERRRQTSLSIPAPPQKDLLEPKHLPMDDIRAAMAGDEPRRLFDYWSSCCKGRSFPNRSDVDVVDIPRPILPYLYLLSIEEDGGFRFRLAGTKLAETMRVDVSDMRLEEALEGYDLQKAQNSYTQVQRSARPWYSCVTYLVDEDVGTIDYQRLTLPLGQDGAVTQLLGGLFIHKERRIYENFHEIYKRRGLKEVARQDYILA